jgi:hypothetical protein
MVERIAGRRLAPIARALAILATIGAALVNGHKWC